jgi:hypothetical protein
MKFVERVELEARKITPGRTILTLIAAVLYAVGWIIGLAVRFVWSCISWGVAAAKVGFQEARGSKGGT